MEIKILNEDKNSIEVELDNLTVVELMRIYLNKEGAKMAAWKRGHPSENPVLRVEADNPKKMIQKAIDSAKKDLEKADADFKKLK